MKKTGSNLATATGLIILLLLLFLAAYLRIALLQIFLIVLLLLCLFAWLWSRKATDKIQVSIRERESHVFPDESALLHLELHNRKFLPVIWLRLLFKGSEKGILETAAGAEISESFSFIMPQQSLSWERPVKGLRRGVVSLSSVLLMSGDGFGLSDRLREVSMEKPFRLVVYPRLLPIEQDQILKHIRELELSAFGLYKDPSLLKFTRPYTGRENLRDINWRSLAKGGEEQVNIRETTDPKRAAFLPDLESFVYEEIIRENDGEKTVLKLREEEMETMLSLIASFIVYLGNRDLYFSLALPSMGSLPARVLIPADHSLQIPELLESLAGIDYHCEKTSFPPELAEDTHHRLGQIYVVSYRPEARTIQLPEGIAVKYLTLDDSDRRLLS